MKQLLLTIWLACALTAISHADMEFRLYRNGAGSAWIDNSILSDAAYMGRKLANRQMDFAKELVAKHGNGYIYWELCEKWCHDEGFKRYDGLAAEAWGETAWNFFLWTIEAHPEWVQWYNSLPKHAKIVIDTSGF